MMPRRSARGAEDPRRSGAPLCLLAAAVVWISGPAAVLAAARERAGGMGLHQDAALDTSSLASGPWSRMEMLLERTIFQVNVLTVQVRVGPTTAGRIAALMRDRPTEESLSAEALEDSLARVAGRADDALVRLSFHRGVGLDRFARAVRSNLRTAAADGYVSAAKAAEIGAAIPRWFSFLRERPIRDGDRILYRIRGDTLRTLFLSADGDRLLDQTDVGPERRLAVLGGYFADGSEFRDGLIASLLE